MDRSIRSSHRLAVIAVSVVILVTMGILLAVSDGTKTVAWWAMLMVFLPPALSLIAATIISDRKTRIVMLWLAGAAMVWPAVLGAFGGWGLLYVIGIIFTLFAAWQENEGR